MMRTSPRGAALRHLAAVLLVGGMGILGCGKKAPSEPTSAPAAEDKTAPAVAVAKTIPAVEPSGPAGGTTPATPIQRDRLHQAFAEATRPADNPPAEANRPPDVTLTGRPAFKILETVTAQWDSIRFTTPDGKKIHYSAHVRTTQGDFHLALLPEQAPNHVRNFIALARAGYYDGLFFERIRHEKSEDRELRSVEAGCPIGTGEPGNGSIGYWLKAEFTPGTTMSHEEGIVGACRGLEADTAACRFYITLNKAPFLDGQCTIFAKVAQGLDVVRKIYQQPASGDDQDPGSHRPEKPVVIHKVTIHEVAEGSK